MEGGRGKHCSKQPVCVCMGRGCKGGHLTVRNIFVFVSVGDKSLLFLLYTPTPLNFAQMKFSPHAAAEICGLYERPSCYLSVLQ